MHILSDHRIVRLHPKLSRASYGTSAEFHEEETVRMAAATDGIQRELDGRTSFTISARVTSWPVVCRVVARRAMSLQAN